MEKLKLSNAVLLLHIDFIPLGTYVLMGLLGHMTLLFLGF